MREAGTVIRGGICGAILGLGIGAITVGPLSALIESAIWPYVFGLVVILGAGLGIATRHEDI